MSNQNAGISLGRWISLSALMLIAFCWIFFFSKSEIIPVKKALSTFPKTIAGYTGTEEFFDQQVYDVLGVDDSALVQYRAPDGKTVQLYVGYYQSQREGDLIHSPKNCLPGSGWLITQTSLESLTIPGAMPRSIKVIRLLLEKDGNKQVVLYWFQSRGRFIASEYMQKIFMVWDSLTRHRTDEAFVRLITPVGGAGVDATTAYMKRFAEELIPVLETYLPGV